MKLKQMNECQIIMAVSSNPWTEAYFYDSVLAHFKYS